jgi:hypothetical protein
MPDGRQLGKKPARVDLRTFKMARYLRAELPAPPQDFDWAPAGKFTWPMLLNDSLGDCVVAGALHSIEEWSGNAAEPIIANNNDALAIYEVFGYVPGNPSTDNGIDMLSFMNYWRKTGLMVGGQKHQILAYVSVNPKDPVEVAQAIYLFGNLFTGVALPLTAQDQEVWSVPGQLAGNAQPGSWGGHCIPIMQYDIGAKYPEGLTCITWGERLVMTWDFLSTYCDEAYAVLSSEWFRTNGLAPNQFNLAQLQADLKAL